jgi:hypothetical protein
VSGVGPSGFIAGGTVGAGGAVAGKAAGAVTGAVSGEWGYLGELYSTMTANLVGHFGSWTAKPVTSYAAGEMAGYTATVYIGSTWDEPIPAAFMDDVIGEVRPVVWINRNIWQLASRVGFTEKLARARRNLVVRDGFASFFYHPHLGVDHLRQTVEGIKAQGYTFVSPTSL